MPQTGQETDSGGEPAQQEAPAPALPLLEQGETAGEDAQLLYIPNPHVESFAYPGIQLFGNGLLFSEYLMGTAQNQFVLKHISLEDGSLISETALSVSGAATVCVGDGRLGVCDSGTGQVILLNDDLTVDRTCTFAQEGESWCLDRELETLYVFFYDEGILARDLTSGEERQILAGAMNLVTKGGDSGTVVFEYTDREDQRIYTRSLNLSTGIVETLPVSGQVLSVDRAGGNWLIRQDITQESYTLVTGNETGTVVWEDRVIGLFSPRNHLLMADPDFRELYLFETDGSSIAHCTLPDTEFASVGSDFIWSGYWEGYFFTDTSDRTSRLLFWDVNRDTPEQPLEILPAGEPEEITPVMEPALYERAQQLSQRFGVSICIAEQCEINYSSYEAQYLTDPIFVRDALDLLERYMESFPEGFFPQLLHGTVEEIRIELVSGLQVKEDQELPDTVAGFAQDRGDHYLVVLDVSYLSESTFCHEIAHVIDARLRWDADLREDALYSEETWLSLQPEGFSYAYSYQNIPEEVLSYADSGYFARDYALTTPGEDRATLMEEAMAYPDGIILSSPGMKEKLRYYSDCIRDCFDTEGWPETTLWERPLRP